MNKKIQNTITAVTFALTATGAFGTTNVFNDAVFWFRGGRDADSNGVLDAGEFFNDRQAGNSSHASHSWVTSWVTKESAYSENAALVSENVVFPALGTGFEKSMKVLRVTDNAHEGLRQPMTLNTYEIFANNNISNEYTIVTRFRLENPETTTNVWLHAIGYKYVGSEEKSYGLLVGFSKGTTRDNTYTTPANMRFVKVFGPNSANGGSGTFYQTDLKQLVIATNTWVDMSIVVGGGKVRIGIANPQLPTPNNNAIAFQDASYHTDNCTLRSRNENSYVTLGQNRIAEPSDEAVTSGFLGSVQQYAVWNRMLSDQEVMEAFGMPRPAVFRTGLANGASDEFGGTGTGSQTIDGLGSWQDVSNVMGPGATWTVNFNAMADEAGLPQVFSMRALDGSSAADVTVSLNGTPLGTQHVFSSARVFWPVPANAITAGANTLTIARSGGSGDLLIDSMELGGSLGVGANNSSSGEMVSIERLRYGCISSASANPKHWPSTLQTYSITNNMLRFWVDPDTKDRCSFAFKTRERSADKSNSDSSYQRKGEDLYTIFVNGVAKFSRETKRENSWHDVSIAIPPEDLHGGWNEIEIAAKPTNVCYWMFDYYRFEATLSKGFSIPPPPPPGTVIYMR